MYEDTRRYIWGGNASGLYYEGVQFESLIVSPDILVENFSRVSCVFSAWKCQEVYSRLATPASFHFSSDSTLTITQSFNGTQSVLSHRC